MVREAIAIGYRHIDTAQAYENERGLGDGLRASGIPRDQLFVTTKLAAECKTSAEAARLIDRSLQTLGLDQIDLMLIHSPRHGRSSARAGTSSRVTLKLGAV
jgi:diketogulonate reductase-like aldo/keto reductase